MPFKHVSLFLLARIFDTNFEQKAIKLRLRQRISTFEVDRVLRRKNGEPVGQRAPDSITRHLTLFHTLKKRRLRAWRHTVHLVNQKQISKNGATVESEFA